MQHVYRIMVTPYGYDYWDIFTDDKVLFDLVCNYYHTDELIEALGQEEWERISDYSSNVEFPYVLLGEHQLRQPD